MNICPICDSQIEGKWCKKCLRFVTPLEIGNGIHFNEEHDIEHETNCEYHNTFDKNQKPDSRYKGEIEKRRQQMEERRKALDMGVGNRVTGKPSVDRKKSKNKKNKKVTNIMSVVIVIWILVGIGSAFDFEIFKNLLKDVNSREMESQQQEIEEVTTWAEKVTAESESVQETTLARAARLLRAMASVTMPIREYDANIDGYDGRVYDYDVSDIEKIGFCCDDMHFDKTYEDIMNLINNSNMADYMNVQNIPLAGGNNYVFDAGIYGFAHFSKIYEIEGDGVTVILDVDTATGQVHNINIVSQNLDSVGFQVAAYEFVNEFIPAYYQGLGAMVEDFRGGLESQTPVEIVSDECEVYYGQSGYSSLMIMPVNEN